VHKYVQTDNNQCENRSGMPIPAAGATPVSSGWKEAMNRNTSTIFSTTTRKYIPLCHLPESHRPFLKCLDLVLAVLPFANPSVKTKGYQNDGDKDNQKQQ
jgi:hypothetical protein